MASWFISPLLSGLMSGFLFMLIRHFILNKVSSQTRSVIETPCSCVYFQPGDFFFMVVVSFKHKTQTVERTSAEIFFLKIHLIWQHGQRCGYATVDLGDPGHRDKKKQNVADHLGVKTAGLHLICHFSCSCPAARSDRRRLHQMNLRALHFCSA